MVFHRDPREQGTPPLGWGPRKDFSLGDSVRSLTRHSVPGGHGAGYLYSYIHVGVEDTSTGLDPLSGMTLGSALA